MSSKKNSKKNSKKTSKKNSRKNSKNIEGRLISDGNVCIAAVLEKRRTVACPILKI